MMVRLPRELGALWGVACVFLLLLTAGCDVAAVDSAGEWQRRSSPLGTGTFEAVSDFGANPGGLAMFRYVPPEPAANAGLVVALHACTQTAQDYRSSGWESVADEYGFYVVYPEQQLANNAMRCFNWSGEYGDPTNLQRGEGENQSIIAMIEQMKADYTIDESRVFVAGHSGGGAQAALMLATWPDVFAGGAMIAGIPYHCTTDFLEVYSCLQPGVDRTAVQWGERVRDAYPDYTGPYPIVSIWHGSADSVVNPANMTELLEQWTDVHGVDAVADVEAEVEGYPHRQYQTDLGETVVETYSITGAGHGTFVEPDTGCGAVGLYMLDEDICSSFYIADFFGLTDGESPVIEPGSDVATTDLGGADAVAEPPPDMGVDIDAGSDGGTPPDADTRCDCQCPGANETACAPCDGGCHTVAGRGPSSVGWLAFVLLFVCVLARRSSGGDELRPYLFGGRR